LAQVFLASARASLRPFHHYLLSQSAISFDMMSSINSMMWQTQNVLHKKPQVVPGTLLLLASSLIVYRHMTHTTYGHDSDNLKTFLAMILVQMLPLVALEMKIMSCADPVGLFCKFATPVTLIHAFFLGMRLVMYSQYDQADLLCSGAGLVGALVAMCKGYRQSWSNIVHCSAVWGLISLALMASLSTSSIDAYFKPSWMTPETWESFFTTVIETSNSYIEIVAFVPAVWIVYREDKNEGRLQVESVDTKRTCSTFFLFLVSFYVAEDLLHAYFAYQISWMVSLAHVVHFCLLLDFSCYVLAHTYNPEKLVGDLRRWLPVDFSHEV